MEILIALIQLLGGFVALGVGAQLLVSGGVSVATRIGISGTVVGLTIISYGTSLPEFTISITSAFSGSSELAFGNVLGSNIANIGLILGFAALIRPINVNSKLLKRDLPLMVFASLLLILFSINGHIGRLEGGSLFFGGAFYTLYLIKFAEKDEVKSKSDQKSLLLNWIYIIGGMVILMIGGKTSVSGAVFLAKYWGMNERVIGITIISVGTSLPELSATIVASWKNKADMALGNIVGSNMFNIFFVLGATAFIHPLTINFNKNLYFDIGLMGFMALVLLPIMFTHRKISRLEGVFILSLYSVYITWVIFR